MHAPNTKRKMTNIFLGESHGAKANDLESQLQLSSLHMANYKDLLAQRQALDAKIEEARKTELSTAISHVQEMVAEFGLTEQDVFGKPGRAPSKGKGSTVAAKYFDPASGSTWSGRGKPPKWIAGQDRSKFAI